MIEETGKDCEIDIQHMVAYVRDQRSGLVQTEAQYRFLYYAIKEYAEMVRKKQEGSAQPTREVIYSTATPVPKK